MVIAIVWFAEAASTGHAHAAVGDFEFDLEFDRIERTSALAIADAHFKLELPAGSGIALIPLPFPRNPEESQVIDPGSGANAVMCGWVRPTEAIGMCAVVLRPKPASIEIKFRRVAFQLREAAEAQALFGIIVPLAEASREVARSVDGTDLLNLRRLTFEIANFQRSTPESRRENSGNSRSIDFSKEAGSPKDVVIYAGKGPEQHYILYVMLGIMGLLIGLASAPKLVTTRVRGFVFGLGSAAAMAGMAIWFFGFLPEASRFSDTTTIVTTGTVFGILIGLAYTSLQFLRDKDRM